MKRKHKTYSRPRRPFDKARIDEEGIIKKEYGLKNKKEIWKADAKIKSMREKAKKLIKSPTEEQQKLFNQLKKIGLNINSIADILALNIRDYLERRLQTVLVRKKLVKTVKEARQLISHKKVLVDNQVVDKPSYVVSVDLEEKITVKKGKLKKVVKKEEEIVSDVPDQEKAEDSKNEEETQKEVMEVAAEIPAN